MVVTRTSQVYRKPTHTDRYLYVESHQDLSQKQVVISTLVERAKIIIESDHLKEELQHLSKALQKTEYSRAGHASKKR